MNRPYGFGGDLSQHPDKSQFKDIPPTFKHHLAQRQMGTPKETQTADGLCLRQILGAPPQAWADYVRPYPIGRQKPFPKKVFAELFP